jgi:hypothetical protein
MAALALLVGCSPRPAIRPGEDFALRPEKQVFFAISAARASDDQRVKILAAYDESQPRLRALDTEADHALQQWRELDRRDPAFAQQASALAEKWGAISRERMALTAAFEARVADIFDADQWQAWQDFWGRGDAGPDERGRHEDGDMGGGRRGGRRR